MKKKTRAHLLLLLTAFIWGVAFVAQDVAMDSMQPFTFNSARLLIAGLALIPCIHWLDRRESAKQQKQLGGAKSPLSENRNLRKERQTLWLGGFCCGFFLFLGSSLQQLGIEQSTAGKAGFLTALYIVIVPLAGIFMGKRVRWTIWIAVALCAAGLFLLCVTESLVIASGDIYLILCAFCFAGHIFSIDYFSSRTDCVRMSCVQFFVAAAFSLGCMALFEQPTWQSLGNGIVPILYAGILSGAVGYTLQILAQRDTEPAVASLLMCLESVFAVLAGWLLLGDLLSFRELCGCVLMLAGIVLAQSPMKKKAASLEESHERVSEQAASIKR